MTLKPTEQDVLAALYRRGDDIQSNLSDSTERTMKSVGRALKALEDKGLIVDKGRGVYRLTEQGETVASNLGDVDGADS